MLGNNHRSRDGEASTVQLNNKCTSLLGQYLLEGEWNFLLDHLSTAEGRRDVHAAKDPLGLFRGRGAVPSNDVTNSAFYAAIHVRAPFSVAKAIYEWERQKPQKDAVVLNRNVEFLMHALAVIPSEEEERLKKQRGSKSANDRMGRMQTWSLEDMDSILEMILRDKDSTFSDAYLAQSPRWIIPSSAPTALPPLGIAAYNPDISAGILIMIYDKEPRAANEECTLFGRTTLPWIVAAASPLPPKRANAIGNSANIDPVISTKYQEQSENRWEKVRFLVAHWDGSDGTHANTDVGSPVSIIPTMEQILRACKEAIRRGEWELVREFLKRHYYRKSDCCDSKQGNGKVTIVPKVEADRATSTSDVPVVMAQPLTQEEVISMSFSSKLPEPSAPSLTLQPSSAAVETTTTTADQAAVLEPIHWLLVQHDQKFQAYYQRNNQKHHSKEEWIRKNMGLVMYQVDAMVDLASAVVPSSWMKKVKNRHSGSGGKDVEEEFERRLVGPMS